MFFILLATCVLVWFIQVCLAARKPRNFPPGPPCLPFVGSAPYLTRINLHFLFEEWRSTYGPVVGFFLGKRPAIAVVGPREVLEVLKAEDFQGRMDSFLIRESTFGERLGVFMTDGPYWVEQRRFALRHLKEFGFGKTSMEGVILDEVKQLTTELSQAGSKPVQVNQLFTVSVINVLWTVMAGTRHGRDDPEFQSLLLKLEFLFRSGNVSGSDFVNLVPSLRFLSAKYRKTYQNQLDLQEFVKKSIREHEKTFDADNPRDFIDVYLREKNLGKPDSTFTEKSLIAVCLDLFAAGSESVSNTLGFCLLYMVLHPEVQAKVQKELDAVVGRDRRVSLQDRPSLPYVEAVLLEVSRSNTIAPLVVPHRVTKDTKFAGYDIPKDTFVFASQWACLQDKDHWTDPEAFRPERFLDSEGKVVRDEMMLTFGTGKRVCLGEALARNTMFLFFASLMQDFTFSLPADADKPSTTCVSGFTVSHQPFHVVVSERE